MAGQYQPTLVQQIVVEHQRQARPWSDRRVLEVRLAALNISVQVDHERQQALFAVGSPNAPIGMRGKSLAGAIAVEPQTFVQADHSTYSRHSPRLSTSSMVKIPRLICVTSTHDDRDVIVRRTVFVFLSANAAASAAAAHDDTSRRLRQADVGYAKHSFGRLPLRRICGSGAPGSRRRDALSLFLSASSTTPNQPRADTRRSARRQHWTLVTHSLDLPRLQAIKRLEYGRHQRAKVIDIVAGRHHDHDADTEASKVLLCATP